MTAIKKRIKKSGLNKKVLFTGRIRQGEIAKYMNEMDVFILYRDLRTYGLREDLYREARSKGIHILRYDFDKELTVSADGEELSVMFTDTSIRRQMEIQPDLLFGKVALEYGFTTRDRVIECAREQETEMR